MLNTNSNLQKIKQTKKTKKTRLWLYLAEQLYYRTTLNACFWMNELINATRDIFQFVRWNKNKKWKNAVIKRNKIWRKRKTKHIWKTFLSFDLRFPLPLSFESTYKQPPEVFYRKSCFLKILQYSQEDTCVGTYF